jgi:hypothetical protein
VKFSIAHTLLPLGIAFRRYFEVEGYLSIVKRDRCQGCLFYTCSEGKQYWDRHIEGSVEEEHL